jgi:hypothetical protein
MGLTGAQTNNGVDKEEVVKWQEEEKGVGERQNEVCAVPLFPLRMVIDPEFQT